jgi:hypothetical protein
VHAHCRASGFVGWVSAEGASPPLAERRHIVGYGAARLTCPTQGPSTAL